MYVRLSIALLDGGYIETTLNVSIGIINSMAKGAIWVIIPRVTVSGIVIARGAAECNYCFRDSQEWYYHP